jgi:hypothetical protein
LANSFRNTELNFTVSCPFTYTRIVQCFGFSLKIRYITVGRWSVEEDYMKNYLEPTKMSSR